MDQLPDCELLCIFERIPDFCRIRVAHVCKRWRELCKRYIRVDICIHLRELRDVSYLFIGKLHLKGPLLECCNLMISANVQSLYLADCMGVPSSIDKFTTLSELYIEGAISNLPMSFGYLKSVKHICLDNCLGLRTLPNLEKLSSLESLVILRCTNLREIPDSIGNLISLRVLTLSGCNRLHTLPETIGDLKELETLHIVCCQDFYMLPHSIKEATSLTTICLATCSSLHTIPSLPEAIVNVNIYQCSSLLNVAPLPHSTRYLSLGRCWAIGPLHSIFELTKLKYLNLEHQQVTSIPDTIGNFTELTELILSNSYLLTSISESIGRVSTLKRIHLRNCTQLTQLPDSIKELSALTTLDLTGCINLLHIPKISSLVYLKI